MPNYMIQDIFGSALAFLLFTIITIAPGYAIALAFDLFQFRRRLTLVRYLIAMLISLAAAIYFLGMAKGEKISEIMESITQAAASITMVLLIIAGAGGFKQVLVDSGLSENIAGLLSQSTLSPLILAWLIAALIRICESGFQELKITTAAVHKFCRKLLF